MLNIKFPRLRALVFAGVIQMAGYAAAMESISDQALGEITGQSLFNTNTSTDGSFTYYRLGLDAQMDLNVNVNQLKLGCDGAGGTGTCDIDLTRVRLTGVGADYANGLGPTKDFMLRRPYIEFAVKNAGSTTNREISGIRMGALEALGTLGVGENPNVNDYTDDTGINRVSGFMVATVTNAQLTDVGVTSLGICCVIGPTTATVTSHTQALILNRDTTFSLTGMSATASGLTLSNTNLNNEPLDNIHQIIVAADSAGTTATKDFYISFQKEALYWQRISTGGYHDNVSTTGGNVAIPAAQKGWWMYMPQVQAPNIVSNQTIRIPTTQAVGGLFGGAVNLNPIDLQQRPTDNCYGTLTFC